MRTVCAFGLLITLSSSASFVYGQTTVHQPIFVQQPLQRVQQSGGQLNSGYPIQLMGASQFQPPGGYPCPPQFYPQHGGMLFPCPPGQMLPGSAQPSPGTSQQENSDEPSNNGEPGQSSNNTSQPNNNGQPSINLTPNQNSIDLTSFQSNGTTSNAGAATGSRSRAMQSGANSIGDFFNGSVGRRSLIATGRSAVFFPSATVMDMNVSPAVPATSADQFRPFTTTTTGTDLNEPVFLRSNAQGQAAAAIPISAGRSGATSEFIPPGLTPVLTTQLAPGSGATPVLEDVGPYVFVESGTVPTINDPFSDPLITQPQAEFRDLNGNGVFDAGEPIVTYGAFREVVIPTPGGNVGMLKASDNNSPLPQDRLIMDYTLYTDTNLNALGVDVHRFSPGFEKSIFGNRASIDVRLPFAKTQSNEISTFLTSSNDPFSLTDSDEIVLGNLSTTFKMLLNRTPYSTVSAGVQAHFPTADDVHVYRGLTPGAARVATDELIRIENESLNIMPFLAFMSTPNQKWWFQLYVQGDFDVKGNPIYIRDQRAVLQKVQTQKDVPFLYTDLSVGRWLYLDKPEIRRTRRGRFVDTGAIGKRGLTGLATRFELHYNTALGDVESASILDPATATHIVGENAGGVDIVNLNLGLTATFGARTEVTVAWGRTVGGSSNQEFGDEVRVLVNLLKPVQAAYRTTETINRRPSPVRPAYAEIPSPVMTY